MNGFNCSSVYYYRAVLWFHRHCSIYYVKVWQAAALGADVRRATVSPGVEPRSQRLNCSISPCWTQPSPGWERWSSWWGPIAARGCWWQWCERKSGAMEGSRKSPSLPAVDAKKQEKWPEEERSRGQTQHLCGKEHPTLRKPFTYFSLYK